MLVVYIAGFCGPWAELLFLTVRKQIVLNLGMKYLVHVKKYVWNNATMQPAIHRRTYPSMQLHENQRTTQQNDNATRRFKLLKWTDYESVMIP
jgi:hypothetical protein